MFAAILLLGPGSRILQNPHELLYGGDCVRPEESCLRIISLKTARVISKKAENV
jgi:hypothetical protein